MAVSVNKNLAASYILEDPLGRIANDGRVSNLGRVGLRGYAPILTNVLSLSGTSNITLPSEVLIPQGQTVSAWFRILNTATPRCLWDGATAPTVYATITNNLITCTEASIIKVDGLETNIFPSDGQMHKIEITFKQNVYLRRFGLRNAGTFPLTGQIRDISYLGQDFAVDSGTQSETGSLGTTLTITGGTWSVYEVQNV